MATVYKCIDISKHNGSIDFKKVKAFGINAAIIRAGLGRTADTRFTANIKAAAAAGLAVGVYWFSYALNRNEALAEADYCKDLIAGYGKNIPVYYDFEYDTERYGKKKNVTYTKSLRTAIIKAFCSRMTGYGYTAGAYLNPDYIKNKINFGELSRYPLWLAQWKTETGVTSFAETKPESVNTVYGVPKVWQIGKGTVPGMAEMCDIDYWYGGLPGAVAAAAVKSDEAATASTASIAKGDRVTVINTVIKNGRKYGLLYGGGYFTVYNSEYDVLSASGDRIVIGVGNAVTAAVRAETLKKV